MINRSLLESLQVLDIKDINLKNTKIRKDDIFINPQINSKVHTQKRKLFSKTLAPRTLRVQEHNKTNNTKSPLVHHSVIKRINTIANYKPTSLKDIKFKIINDELEISDIREGIHSLFS